MNPVVEFQIAELFWKIDRKVDVIGLITEFHINLSQQKTI